MDDWSNAPKTMQTNVSVDRFYDLHKLAWDEKSLNWALEEFLNALLRNIYVRKKE